MTPNSEQCTYLSRVRSTRGIRASLPKKSPETMDNILLQVSTVIYEILNEQNSFNSVFPSVGV